MFWYSNGKPDDFTKVNKRTEPGEYAYNSYGFYLKKFTGLNQCLPEVGGIFTSS